MRKQYPRALENFYRDMPVLVTGGAGFIGSHIVETLVLFGAKVTVLDDLSSGTLENLNAVHKKIHFIHDTITDLDACLHAATHKQLIFHLAARTSVPESERDPDSYHKVNILATHNLLRAAVQKKAHGFVFSSSAAVYGNQEHACAENSPVKPTSFYGLTKLIGEIMVRYFEHKYSLNTVSLRYFNVYGSRQHPDTGVVAQFRHRLQNNLPISVFGNGSQTRDFVSVEKIVHANLMAGMKTSELSGEVINVASGSNTSILQMLEDLKLQYPNYTGKISFQPKRQGDINHSKADCSKLSRQLGEKL